ncbi:MAG: hypothetical protein EZS26_002174 [Candidatus Ordinivivax streblomastigis]|uniref:Outer membrane protein beta-barrel domain-containing protein n=1 Tax=Candidatus Ordinivivax streblomastigis TaxID=2540710 RepID=A0A5M8NZW4_9BACT|nr:MAG: hypothetical protein EZS26_002174 [Candidatus Ordinivivax streblomastigis]
MKKQLFLLLWLIVSCSAYSQRTEYRKVYLSISGGLDFPIGQSDTKLFDSDFILPFAKNGWGGSFEGAYFFTPNYGVGVKYHLYLADYKKKSLSQILWDVNENIKHVPIDKFTTIRFDEMTHYVGPALFGRWIFGKTRWSALANVGVGCVYNKLSKIKQKIDYGPLKIDYGILWFGQFPYPERRGFAISPGTTFGATCSAGINYQIIPAIGIHVSVNGMFASISKINTDESITPDFSRKLNRIGLAAGLNCSF